MSFSDGRSLAGLCRLAGPQVAKSGHCLPRLQHRPVRPFLDIDGFTALAWARRCASLRCCVTLSAPQERVYEKDGLHDLMERGLSYGYCIERPGKVQDTCANGVRRTCGSEGISERDAG